MNTSKIDFLPLKEFYDLSDFPKIDLAVQRDLSKPQLLAQGSFQGRFFREISIEIPEGFLGRMMKAVKALYYSTLSLFCRSYESRPLWEEVFSGKTIKQIKLLDPDPVPQEHRQLFQELKGLLEASHLDMEKVSEFFVTITKVKVKDMDSKSRIAYLALINSLRTPFWKTYRSNIPQNKNTENIRQVMDQLDEVGYQFSGKYFDDLLVKHFSTYPQENKFAEVDGKITADDPASPAQANRTLASVERDPDWKSLPGYNQGEIEFQVEQLPVLSQVDAQNFLCGYYAGFFLSQAIKGEMFLNRDAFNSLITSWRFDKRKQISLAVFREQEVIPLYYRISGGSLALGPEEISQNLANIPELKENPQWFVLDPWQKISEEEKEIGINERSNIFPEARRETRSDFPLYLIYQPGISMHYYFVKAEKTHEGALKLSIAHSLNYNVIEGHNSLGDDDWRGLLNYLTLLLPNTN